eukprot:2769633-Pyramimonas_sp.AAC.3
MPPDYEYTASAAEDWATGGTGLMEPLPDIDEDNERWKADWSAGFQELLSSRTSTGARGGWRLM